MKAMADIELALTKSLLILLVVDIFGVRGEDTRQFYVERNNGRKVLRKESFWVK